MNPHQSSILKKLNSLSGKYSAWQIWTDFIIMSAISISNTVDYLNAPEREKQYMMIAERYTKQELNTMAEMLTDFVNGVDENPDQDFLGELFMSCGFGNDAGGQFFTPYSICRMMAQMNCNDVTKQQIEQKGFVSVNDCACGAGALLLAFANECRRQGINYQQSVLFVAQDIDYLTGCMCYLQLSVMGCPGYVYIGNTLTNPCITQDKRGLLPTDPANTWYTPMYCCSEIWTMRKMMHKLDSALFTPATPTAPPKQQEAKQIEKPPVVEKKKIKKTPEPTKMTKDGQMMMF